MCLTFIFYYRACKAQGIDRNQFSYTGWFQPYCAYFGLAWMTLVAILYGYPAYKPWDVSTFFSVYTMQIFVPPLFLIWKFVKGTKLVKPHEADLVWDARLLGAALVNQASTTENATTKTR